MPDSFEYPKRPKKAQEDADHTFLAALEAMLVENETITARAVVTRLDGVGFGHASSITRDEWRTNVLEEFKNRQSNVRKLIDSADHSSKTNLVAQIEKAKKEIAELQSQVNILVASHRAMIHAVGEVGGMAAWKRFFVHYQDVIDRLQKMGAMAPVVIPLRRPPDE